MYGGNPEEGGNERYSGLRQQTIQSNPVIPGAKHRSDSSDLSDMQKNFIALREEIHKLTAQNIALRKKYQSDADLGSLNTDRQDSMKSNVFTDMGDKQALMQHKYNKALKEITKLMGINKQLKKQLSAFKNGQQNEEFTIVVRQRDDLKFTNHRLETTVKELESTNNLYSGQLSEYENQIQSIKQQYEEKLRQMIMNMNQKDSEMRLRYENMEEMIKKPNQAVFELKLTLERHKKQEAVWQAQRTSFYEKILQLQGQVDMAKIHKEQMKGQYDSMIQELQSKFRKEIQQEIFQYKSQSNNLKQNIEALMSENQRLNRELKFSLSTKAERTEEEGKIIYDLQGQIQNFMQQVCNLKLALSEKRQLEAELQILKSQVIHLNNNNQHLTVQNQHLKTQLDIRETEHRKQRKVSNVQPLSISMDMYQLQKDNDKLFKELNDARDEVSQLRGQNHLLQQDLQQLQHHLRMSKRQTEEFQTTIPTKALHLTNKLREFKLHIDLLNNSRTMDVQKEISLMRTILTDIVTNTGIILQENSISQVKVKKYKEKVQSIKEKYDEVSKENKKLHQKIKGYERLVSKFQMQLENSFRNSNGAEVQKKVYRPSDLQEKLDLQQKSFQQEMQTKVLEFEAKLLQKKLQIDNLREDANSFELYKNKIKEMAEKIMELESLNSQYWGQLNRSRLEYTEGKASSQNTELVSLIQKLSEKDNKIISLDYKIARLTDLQTHADLRLRDMQAALEIATQDYSQARNKVMELELNNDSLRQQLTMLEIKCRNAENAQIMRSTSSIQPSPDFLQIKENEVTELKNIVKKLTENCHNLQYDLNLSRRNLSAKSQQAKRYQEELSDLKMKAEDTNYRLEKMKKEQIELNSTINSSKYNLEQKESHFRSQITQLKLRLESSETQIAKLRQAENALMTAKYEISSQKAQSDRLKDQIMMLESQLRHHNELRYVQPRAVVQKDVHQELELYSLKQERQRHRQIQESLMTEVNDLTSAMAIERKKYSQQVMQLRNQIIQLESLKRDYEMQMQSTSSSLTLRLNQAVDENGRLEEQVQELKRRIARLEAELIDGATKISNLEGQIFRLNQENKEIERLHQQLKLRQNEINGLSDKVTEMSRVNMELEAGVYDLDQSRMKAQQLSDGNHSLFEEVDRLRKINMNLEQDIKDLRLRYSGEINYELRLKENLALFVILFAQVESLRSQLQAKNNEMEVSRRSEIAMASRFVQQAPSSPYKEIKSVETLNLPFATPVGELHESQVSFGTYESVFPVQASYAATYEAAYQAKQFTFPIANESRPKTLTKLEFKPLHKSKSPSVRNKY